VEWLVRSRAEEAGIEGEVIDDEAPKPLSERSRSITFQAVRELVINVVRHACAGRLSVRMSRVNDHLRVEVVDDGVGFDPDAAGPDMTDFRRFGLFSVRERIESIGGHFIVYSGPGEGTRATLAIPLEKEASHGAEDEDTPGR
jgi:signal transduction histidine kinase